MILRLPLKLNARIGGGTLGALAPHANPLLDWSVRAFEAGRTEYLLLSNTRSLYSSVLDGVASEDVDRFVERLVGVIRATLEGAGRGTTVGHREEPAVDLVQFAKALGRSVTGSMNELAAHAAAMVAGGGLSVHQVGSRLNDVLLSALAGESNKYGRPRDAFQELIPRDGL